MSDIVKRSGGKGVEIMSAPQGGWAPAAGGVGIQIWGEPKGSAYLALDCSGSMEGEKITQARRGALDFARGARAKGYAVGLIAFSDEAIHICEPQADIARLSAYLETVRAGSATNMAEALSVALQKLKGKTGNRAVVLVTDGQPNRGEPDPVEATFRAARALKDAGIEIITIGTDDADAAFLKQIATSSGLSVMVEREELGRGIGDATAMLPEGPRH